MDSAPLLLLFIVWANIYQGQDQLGGYTLAGLVQYYLLSLIISGVSSTYFEDWRVREIREGKIDYFLIRPLSYLMEILCRDIGGKLFYLVNASLFFIILTSGLFLSFAFSLTPPGPLQILQTLSLIFVAYAIEFLIALIIVISGFWIEGADGLEHFKWIAVATLSGSMIPISLMPSWLQQIVQALPFKYMYAYPIGIWQGTVTLHLSDYVYVGVFLGVLWVAMRLLWTQALKRYASSGG